jgi:hypothetical protein
MGAFLNVMCRVEELAAERDELTSWFLVASEHLTDLPAGGMRTVQIDLPSVSFVTVDVRELGSRRPLADAYVTFRSLGRFGTGRSSLGSPSTVLLPEGSYIVLVTVKNHQWGFRRLEVGAGDGDVVLEVDLSRADEHLVRISDEAGAPFAKAVVSVRHWEGMTIGAYIANGGRPLLTNASGFVDLGFLPDEAFGLSVRSDDRVYEAVLEPGIGELVLEREGGWPVQHVESGSR